MGLLGNIFRIGGIISSPGPSIDLGKTIDTVRVLTEDQKTEGKKEGYADAAKEYEPIYTDLKQKYDCLIADIRARNKDLDVRSETGLLALQHLEAERNRLKAELQHQAEIASSKLNMPPSMIISTLNGGATGVITTPGLDSFSLLCSGIIELKRKERMKARQAGYLEAKELYEEKITQLREHYRISKDEADIRLKEYADSVSTLLNEIETVRFQIADLQLAMET